MTGPTITVQLAELGQAHSTAYRDPNTGVVTVTVGSVNHRILFADDPAILLVLLEDAAAQIRAIAAG